MTAAHTPGPWRIGDAGAAIFGPKTQSVSPPTVVSSMGKAGGDTTAARANARLIAAAPDMLAALRDLLAGMEQHGAEKWMPHRMERARAAIAKAGG